MSNQSFKDLLAWQAAQELTVAVYRLFKDQRDFGFRDQIQRASVSVMNNIAEGSSRGSNKSFRNFLLIARGSNTEVESMILLASKLGYTNKIEEKELLEKTTHAGKLITGLINKLSV